MAYASFAAAFIGMFVGIYTLEEPLAVKGYYAVTALYLTMASFVLQKVVRDNAEDEFAAKKRNTKAFTFMSVVSFALALLAMFVGIINLEQSLPVKGYYAMTSLFLTMSSFVLQKTIRDNQEDEAFDVPTHHDQHHQ